MTYSRDNVSEERVKVGEAPLFSWGHYVQESDETGMETILTNLPEKRPVLRKVEAR